MPYWTVEQRDRAVKLLSDGYSYRATALQLKNEFGREFTYHGVRGQVRMYDIPITKKDRYREITKDSIDFETEELPKEDIPIGDLIDQRITKYKRKRKAKTARKLVNIKIKVDGPIGVAHFGDPHVDDDGTDLAMLFNHVDIVNNTEGMFAGNVGDMQNNWIGRLARLYGQQSTSARESWRLTEYFVTEIPWLYLVGGNHDVWSGDGDPLLWILSESPGVFQNYGARINLRFPNGRQIRINARHNFQGHSMWNTAHGPAKAVQMGWRDHILTCGHIHTSGYQVLKDPASGLISHAIRTASYKVMDSFAESKGMPDQHIFCCPVTIIDPAYDDHDPRLITTIFDPEEAADYLTWKRSKENG